MRYPVFLSKHNILYQNILDIIPGSRTDLYVASIYGMVRIDPTMYIKSYDTLIKEGFTKPTKEEAERLLFYSFK